MRVALALIALLLVGLVSPEAAAHSCANGICNCFGDEDCVKLASASACSGAMTCSGRACSCPFGTAAPDPATNSTNSKKTKPRRR